MKKKNRNNYTSRQKVQVTKAMLIFMNRSSELNRLIAWAVDKCQACQEKKFFFIQRSYERRHDTMQEKLLILRRQFPAQYWLARILHRFSKALTPKAVYYAGSASAFRN